MENEVDRLVDTLWDYLKMDMAPGKADIILALGSNDVRVAVRAAELFLEGRAPLIMFSGGIGRLTRHFPKPEAEVFADAAMRAGVPRQKIIIENRSTNTGENIAFSQSVLKGLSLDPHSFILVTKPYMERRAWAAFKKLVPHKKVTVTSPPIDFRHYPFPGLSREDVINIAVGDLQRIKLYPDKGYQIPQEIPGQVWQAYERMVALGYDKCLVS